MSKYSKVLAFMVCLILCMALFTGCGENNNIKSGSDSNEDLSSGQPAENAKKEKVTIEWSVWGNPGENLIFEQFTNDFNSKYADDINLKYTPIPSDGYSQKILSSLAAGTARCIISW